MTNQQPHYNTSTTSDEKGISSLKLEVLKLRFSRQYASRLQISNLQGTNMLFEMTQLQKRYDFDFSYFYFSELARQADWLTAISGKPSECSTRHQVRHRPACLDWHHALTRIRDSKHNTFIIVLDNVAHTQKFQKMKRLLVDAIWRHRIHLNVIVKYLFIKRHEPEINARYE